MIEFERGEKIWIKKEYFLFTTCYNTLLLVEVYCSMLLKKKKKMGFSTPHEVWYFVFGVLNAKDLAFSTLDANALLLLLRSLTPLFA